MDERNRLSGDKVTSVDYNPRTQARAGSDPGRVGRGAADGARDGARGGEGSHADSIRRLVVESMELFPFGLRTDVPFVSKVGLGARVPGSGPVIPNLRRCDWRCRGLACRRPKISWLAHWLGHVGSTELEARASRLTTESEESVALSIFNPESQRFYKEWSKNGI